MPSMNNKNNQVLNQNFSTTELLKDPIYKEMIDAREKAKQRAALEVMEKKENEFGEELFRNYNPFTARNQGYDKAEFIAKTYNAMLQRVLPPDGDAVISTQFQNWILSERNQMLYDQRLKYDNNFYRIDYNTGAVRSDNELMMKQREVIETKIANLEKSFITFATKNPEAWADAETLQNRAKYYEQRAKIIKEAQEQGVGALLKVYSKKVERGDVSVENVEEEAKKNLENIDKKMAAIDKAIEATNAMGKKADAPMNPDIANVDLDELKTNRPRNH